MRGCRRIYRFVHAADLHLDSPFRGLTAAAPEQAEALRRATFEAYDQIVELCIDQQVDALLVAGDIFDSADNSLGAQLQFRDGLIRLAERGIRSFICHGNHDPLDGWHAGLDWPDHAYRFGETVTSVPLRADDPRSPLVYGVSYPVRDVQQNLIPTFPQREAGRPAIGLLHANVGGNPDHGSYAPCSIDDLTATGYDYWALGHVHTRQILRTPQDGAPVIAYPGSPQGRHPNERGPRGVYVVEMDQHGVVTDPIFHSVDVVRWAMPDLAIDGLHDDQELLDTLETTIQAELDAADGRNLVYRVRLSGRGELHGSLGRSNVLDDLRARLNELLADRRPFALCDRVIDATASFIDRDELARGGDFVADLLALIEELRADPEALNQFKENASLDDLYGHAKAGRYLRSEMPAGNALLSLIDDAERILLDGLVEEIEPR